MYCYTSLFTFFVDMGYIMGKGLLTVNAGRVGDVYTHFDRQE